MLVSVDWDSNPINIWHLDKPVLENLLQHLKSNGVRRHSIVMHDRERDGFLFFVYEKMDPQLILVWEQSR